MYFNELAKKLESTNNPIIISTHANPDGDAIGSTIAMAYALRSKGKKVSILMQESLHDKFKFLEHYLDMFALEQISDKDNPTVIVIDSNSIDKLGTNIKNFLLNEVKVKEFIFVDHHEPDKKQADSLYFIWEKASSTGELVYKLITEEFGLKIDNVMAECIYTAIVCDTSSFRYSRTNSYSHYIASELIKLGIEPEKIQTQLYGCNTIEQIQLLGYVLMNTKLSSNGKIAYVYLPMEKMKEHKAGPLETKGFINNLLTIKNVEIAVLFRQDSSDTIKVSMRSNGMYNVRDVAQKFDGGGQKFSGTFVTKKSYNDIVKELLPELMELKRNE